MSSETDLGDIVKKTIMVLALSAALVVAALAPAFAHHDTSIVQDSSITMRYKARRDRMVGTVTSAKTQCSAKRTVKVYKITRTGRKLIDTVATRADGRWSLPMARANGRYGSRATLKSVTLASGSNSYGVLWKHLLQCSIARTTTRV